MLDKKQDRLVFLFEFKMGHKIVGTTCNITNSSFPRPASERTVHWWFNKVCEGDEYSEDEECNGWPLEFDNDQLRWTWKLILLQLQDMLLKNSVLTILWSFSIWSKLERWKSAISECLMSWLQKKKKSSFWSIIFSYAMQQQQTISWSDCDMWWIVDFVWQPVMTSSVVGPRRSSKDFPKPNFHQKKKKGHGHCLVVCCPSDPLQLSGSQQNHYICEVHSVNH